MLTYNEELEIVKTSYLKFCSSKELNANLLENVYFFIEKNKSFFSCYFERETFINDFIECVLN